MLRESLHHNRKHLISISYQTKNNIQQLAVALWIVHFQWHFLQFISNCHTQLCNNNNARWEV